MMLTLLRKLSLSIVLFSLIIPSSWAQEKGSVPTIELQDLALPSDLKELPRSTGAIFYSATSKNKPLMPVHIWGEVGKPGLHYIPVDSKLVKGLSFAGGGSSSADLEEVIVNRPENGKINRKEFDLSGGGDAEAQEFVLRPGDTVFVEKDTYIQDRSFYVSLIGVVATILASVLIIKRIEQVNK